MFSASSSYIKSCLLYLLLSNKWPQSQWLIPSTAVSACGLEDVQLGATLRGLLVSAPEGDGWAALGRASPGSHRMSGSSAGCRLQSLGAPTTHASPSSRRAWTSFLTRGLRTSLS